MKNTQALQTLLDSQVDMTNIRMLERINTSTQVSPAKMLPVSDVVEELRKIDNAIADLTGMRNTITALLDKHMASETPAKSPGEKPAEGAGVPRISN